MSQELSNPAPFKPSALAVMASKFSVEPAKLLETLKSTVFKGATNEELLALVVVANSYGLNPLTKEIYAFPAKGGGIVPVVSVDGWNNMANSHPQMDGMEFEFEHSDKGALISCTCIIHRKDRSHPIRVTEYLSECKRATDPWKMEHRMLRHKALIQCVRIAFGFSGVVDEEDAAGMRDVTPAVQVAKLLEPPKPKKAKVEPVESPLPQDTYDQIAAMLIEDEVAWLDIANAAEQGGVIIDVAAPLLEQPEDTLMHILAAWTDLVAIVKEGGR